ncbi:hypothetical protein [Micromonospora sp. NPDC005291]|uniref:hypothetical protein n=1 Tax=Micromonospora sp. NPDC005291 TaxID=3156872 RepID=UPI0033BF3E2D
MTIHVVDIEQVTHTCPAFTQAHPYDTRRTVIHVIPGGACRTPVTIRCGETTATIACHRHEPADRQCGACRIIVTQHTITTRHLPGEAA